MTGISFKPALLPLVPTDAAARRKAIAARMAAIDVELAPIQAAFRESIRARTEERDTLLAESRSLKGADFESRGWTYCCRCWPKCVGEDGCCSCCGYDPPTKTRMEFIDGAD